MGLFLAHPQYCATSPGYEVFVLLWLIWPQDNSATPIFVHVQDHILAIFSINHYSSYDLEFRKIAVWNIIPSPSQYGWFPRSGVPPGCKNDHFPKPFLYWFFHQNQQYPVSRGHFSTRPTLTTPHFHLGRWFPRAGVPLGCKNDHFPKPFLLNVNTTKRDYL